MAKTWLGKRDKCDICKIDLSKRGFIDGRTVMGPWALMCSFCHTEYGVGLGLGKGQMYDAEGVQISGGAATPPFPEGWKAFNKLS